MNLRSYPIVVRNKEPVRLRPWIHEVIFFETVRSGSQGRVRTASDQIIENRRTRVHHVNWGNDL